MLYTTRILFPVFVVSMLAACGGNDSATPPTRVEGQENPPTLSAGSDQQAAERRTIELRATVQNTDQNSVVAYAWFPASEETVFFGEAGRSDESVLNLQLPQVNNDTPVEFIVQAQLSNGNVLEDRVQITIQNTFDNALPVVTTTASPIGLDNRLTASACESSDSDGTIQSYQWRNETLNIQYEETSCNLNVQLPNSPESQTYTLRAIAIDNEAGLGFELFEITTPQRPANTAPVIQNANALPEPVRPGETLNLQVNATDADGDALFYRWTQTAGSALQISNADKRMAQVQIPADLANQTLSFRIEVSDRANFQTSVDQRSVDASVRSNTSSNAGLLECLQDPTRVGCPLAGLLPNNPTVRSFQRANAHPSMAAV
jgi:hypothetical protein